MPGEYHAPEVPGDQRVWRLPNGRFVFRVAGGYVVQPPRDNWWHFAWSIKQAVNWWAKREYAST
jgi:hypothetical protein